MAEGLTNALLFESLIIGLLAAIVAWRCLPLKIAVGIATVRVTIPVIYFAWYFDGSWTFLDDWAYFGHGSELLQKGHTPWTVLLVPEAFEQLQSLSGGNHILYGWWNVLAQYLFGEFYYAPVIMNVLLTFVTGAFLFKTLSVLEFERSYCQFATGFYLLHWDIVAWSSVLNLKDVLVQLLTVVSLYCTVAFVRQRKVRFLCGFLVVLQLFFWIRFYVPLLILISVAIWLITQWRDNRKYLFIPFALLPIFLALPLIEDHLQILDLNTLLFNTLRFVGMPLPWQVEETYTFLIIPSIMHWVFLFPSCIGLWYLWRCSNLSRLYVIYFALAVALYATSEDLLGPRQRFQIAFVFIWGQAHFLWMMRPARYPARTALARRDHFVGPRRQLSGAPS